MEKENGVEREREREREREKVGEGEKGRRGCTQLRITAVDVPHPIPVAPPHDKTSWFLKACCCEQE
jgi:hypothetical protein